MSEKLIEHFEKEGSESAVSSGSASAEAESVKAEVSASSSGAEQEYGYEQACLSASQQPSRPLRTSFSGQRSP